MSESLKLFVVYCDPESAPEELEGDARTLSPGLFLIRAEQSQSQLYHKMKRQLPEDTALLVVTAASIPKFKSMTPGSTKWVRGKD